MISFLSGIWGKIAAGAAFLLLILGIIWRIFAKGEAAGVAKAREQQRKAADTAKARMDENKQVKGDDGTTTDLDSGTF